MPSNAFEIHFKQLLRDAEELDDAHFQLKTGAAGRQYGIAALNRAVVVVSVSAWESYVEELLRESSQVLKPSTPPFDPWPALNAFIESQVSRFHTPNAANVDRLIRDCLGLSHASTFWVWRNSTSIRAVQRLNDILTFRHQIAHGVNPRPVVHHHFSSELPGFFLRLARATDAAVRQHLVLVYSVGAPWPA